MKSLIETSKVVLTFAALFPIHPRQPLKPEVKFTESLVYEPIQFIWEKIFEIVSAISDR